MLSTLLRQTLLICCCLASMLLQAAPNSFIDVPVRFHIVQGLSMQKGSVAMDSWVTPDDVRNVIVNEVNRIWLPAQIRYVVHSVNTVPSVDHPDRVVLLTQIVDATRDDEGHADPARIDALEQLLRLAPPMAGVLDVYLVPYMGEKSQGNARRAEQRIFVAQYTDKMQKGKNAAPERFQLLEYGDFKKGSLSRTIAHELGHLLGLRHPDKKAQRETGLLMGGRQPGNKLSAPDIATARMNAGQLQ